MKLSNDLCLECSTCAIFLSSSLMVSIIALFLSKSLSDIFMIEPFMLLFSFVMSCIPSTKSLLNRFLLIYPLSPTSLPYMKSTNALYSNGLRSSISPGVIMKLSNSPFSLHIRWSLKPKNHPIEHLPLWAMPLNVLWIWILWVLHTRRGVLSTKLMPVHFPKRTFFIKIANGMAMVFWSSTKRLYDTTFGNKCQRCTHTYSFPKKPTIAVQRTADRQLTLF